MKLRAVSAFEKYSDCAPLNEITDCKHISVLAARNGYECAQILIFAEQDLQYRVVVSDLLSDEGSSYTASNISVYAEKYIFVDRNWQTNGLPTGNYPDALLPIENAMEYGETHIEAGKSKGVWLEFFIPADQMPGIYRGTVTVTGNVIQEMPVILEVLPLDIPERTGVRSLFHTNYEHMSRYEKGDMVQMYDKYIQYLLNHRICQTEFAHVGSTDAGITAFAEKAAQLYKQGYNTFSIPSIEKKLDGYITFDEGYLEKYLFALAEKSLECGVDLVKCVAFYDWRIDEPFFVGYKPGQVEASVERFSQSVRRVSEKCAQLPDYNSDLGKSIVSSLRKTVHVITDYYEQPYTKGRVKTNRNGQVYQYDCPKVTLCPKYDGYDSLALAAPYGDCQERWWYGCNVPNAPFVTYHIDDAVYSPRIIGNLMARHGIVGTLYWANNIYTEINTTGKPLFLDDPYQIAHRGFGATGDGAILYPGSQYGVDGPVGCIRLKQIREGHQDFDLLMQVQKRYEQLHASFTEILDRQLSYLCNGSKIDSIHGSYDIVHESLLRLAEAVMAPLGLTVQCIADTGGVTYTVRTCEDSEVYVNGEAVTIIDGVCTFVMPYVAGNWFELKLCSGGIDRVIPLYQGKGMQIILHEVLFENNAVTAPQGDITLNPDDVRREITVNLKSPGLVHIRLDDCVEEGEEVGFEIRTTEPCFCSVYADGFEQEQQRFKTIPRWNRIQISTNTKGFHTNGINIYFEDPGKFGVGAVYIRR